MSVDLVKAFHQALEKRGIITNNNPEAPLPHLLEYGRYRLADNVALASSLCNDVAEQTKAFWTLTEFKRLQSNTPEKPLEIDKEDAQYWPSKNKTYPAELIQKYSTNGRDGLKFLRATERAKKFNNALKDYEKRNQSYQRLLSQVRRIRATYNFDERGYLAFVLDALQMDLPEFAQNFFFTPNSLWINEEARKKHTFITGGTGAGKSETIKHIIRHYLTKNTEPAIVVLDPHGDLADDVAKFEENAANNRLVYIYPGRFKGRDISFNPFDTVAKDEVSLNRGQVQFLGAIEQMIGHALTYPQRALLTPCLGVLLHKDGASLKDLVNFMDDRKNGDLVNYGATKLPNEQDRAFFKDQFSGRNFESTKEALQYRFNEIIREPSVRNFLCNESTINLRECIEAGKVTVFRFDQDKQSKEEIKTIGQLMTAYITSYAMGRSKGNRRPIHLFADECQYFISPTISQIMGESRKFGLYATLATQRTEQVGREVLDAIFGNVGCYLIGRNKAKTAEKMAKELPLNADDIRELPKLHFYQVELDRDPIKTKIEIIGSNFALETKAWRALLLEQGKQYYTSGLPTPEYTTATTTADLSHANETRQHSSQVKPKFSIPDVTKK